MNNTQSTYFGTNKRHLEILTGFRHVLNRLEQKGVAIETIEYINKKTKKAYFKHNNFDFSFKLIENNILIIDGEKIPLRPKGLNGIYDDILNYNNGSGSSFYSNGSFSLDGLTSALSSTGDPTLAAIGTGLQLLDGLGLDIEANINNVFQFGLNSWGANSNPEEGKEKARRYMAYISEKILPNFDFNPQDALNELDHSLNWGENYYIHLLKDHTRADSTRASHQVVIEAFRLAKKEVLNPIIADLKSKGITIQSQTVTDSSIPNIYIAWDSNKNDVINIFHNERYTHYTYSLSIQNINQAGMLPTNNSNSGLLAVAGLGALAWLIIPKLINKTTPDKKRLQSNIKALQE